MKKSDNPFDNLRDSIVSEIKGLLNQLLNNKPVEQEIKPTFDKIPIQEIFRQRILSKPTLYEHIRAGRIKLYKLGGRSFVDRDEFNSAFEKVVVSKPNQEAK